MSTCSVTQAHLLTSRRWVLVAGVLSRGSRARELRMVQSGSESLIPPKLSYELAARDAGLNTFVAAFPYILEPSAGEMRVVDLDSGAESRPLVLTKPGFRAIRRFLNELGQSRASRRDERLVSLSSEDRKAGDPPKTRTSYAACATEGALRTPVVLCAPEDASFDGLDRRRASLERMRRSGVAAVCFVDALDPSSRALRAAVVSYERDEAADFPFCLGVRQAQLADLPIRCLATAMSSPKYLRPYGQPILLVSTEGTAEGVDELVAHVRSRLPEHGVPEVSFILSPLEGTQIVASECASGCIVLLDEPAPAVRRSSGHEEEPLIAYERRLRRALVEAQDQVEDAARIVFVGPAASVLGRASAETRRVLLRPPSNHALLSRLRSLTEHDVDASVVVRRLDEVLAGYERSLNELRSPRSGALAPKARFRNEPPSAIANLPWVRKGDGHVDRAGDFHHIDGLVVRVGDSMLLRGWWFVRNKPIEAEQPRFLCLQSMDSSRSYFATVPSNLPRLEVAEAHPTQSHAVTLLCGFELAASFEGIAPGVFRLFGVSNDRNTTFFTPFDGTLEVTT